MRSRRIALPHSYQGPRLASVAPIWAWRLHLAMPKRTSHVQPAGARDYRYYDEWPLQWPPGQSENNPGCPRWPSPARTGHGPPIQERTACSSHNARQQVTVGTLSLTVGKRQTGLPEPPVTRESLCTLSLTLATSPVAYDNLSRFPARDASVETHPPPVTVTDGGNQSAWTPRKLPTGNCCRRGSTGLGQPANGRPRSLCHTPGRPPGVALPALPGHLRSTRHHPHHGHWASTARRVSATQPPPGRL